MDNGMKTVGVGVLKELFKDILEEFPELGADSFYEILRASNFDVKHAIEQIRHSFDHPKTFEIPSSLVNNGLSPVITLQSSNKRSRSGRLLTPPITPEDASNNDTEGCIEFDTSHTRSSARRVAVEVSSDEENDNDHDPKWRPTKRYAATLSPCTPLKKSLPRLSHAEESSDEEGRGNKRQGKRGRSSALFSQLRYSPPRQGVSRTLRRPSSIVPLSSPVEFSDIDEELESLEPLDSVDETPTPPQYRAVQRRRVGKGGNIDDAVLKNKKPTCATTYLRALAGNLFARDIAPAEVNEYDDAEMDHLRDVTGDPTILKRLYDEAWEGSNKTEKADFRGPQTWCDDPWTSLNPRTGFDKAVIDGVEYRAGDYVLVRTAKKRHEAQKSRKYHNSDHFQVSEEPESKSFHVRFARISYMFGDEFEGKYAHLRFFSHGSELSVLGELAAPRALFLLTECRDEPLTRIASKLNVEYIDSQSGVVAQSKFTQKNHFFYRFQFKPTSPVSGRITDAALHETSTETSSAEHCSCCAEEESIAKSNATSPIGDTAADGSLTGFERKGVNYHLHDFVYFVPEQGKRAGIGQIVRIETVKQPQTSRSSSKRQNGSLSLVVRHLLRSDEIEHFETHGVRDNRKLYTSNKNVCIFPEDLDGKCDVLHVDNITDLDNFKNREDTFWVAEKVLTLDDHPSFHKTKAAKSHKIRSSIETALEFSKFETSKNNFLANGGKIKALELFAGVGGMALGLDLSGVVETKWMVEAAPAAAQTAKGNLPGSIVYNEDANVCLKRFLEQEAGIFDHSEHQVDNSGAPVQAMPRRREVLLIVAGFPCPGYSTVNRHHTADDVKNTLILTTLSYIECYRPKYVLLENVMGLIHHKLAGTQVSKGKIEGGIDNGTIKFIYWTLTDLGYQVDYTVLQAGEYDTPQSRQRVIFWGALQGCKLPKFPQPTTTFAGRCPEKYASYKTRRCAPHRGISAEEAIGDLPAYDWINPRGVMGPPSYHEDMEQLKRAETIEQLHITPNQAYVGRNEQGYATAPTYEFQRKIRAGVGDGKLTNHVTPNWFDVPSYNAHGGIRNARTEQVCSVAMTPRANHSSLPLKLKPSNLSRPGKNASSTQYGRIDAKGYFPICLTIMDPGRIGSTVIHPSQKRVLSVREYARAEGFHDSFKWNINTAKDIKLAYRMIANAVPPPLGKAIGGELLKVLISEFENKPRDRNLASEPKIETDQEQICNNTLNRTIANLGKKSVRVSWMKKKGESVEDAINLDDDDEGWLNITGE